MGTDNRYGQYLEGLLFPKIFRSFRMAIQPSKLIIAFGLIAAIGLSGWVMDIVTKSVVTTPITNGGETELNMYMNAPQRLDSYIERYAPAKEHTGVFSTLWEFSRERFHGTLKELFAFNLPGILYNVEQNLRAFEWAFKYHTIYCVVFGLIGLCLVSIAGGAISRIAALEFSRDEKPGITEALSYGVKKFTSFFIAPLFPAGFIFVAGAFIFIVGLTANIPLGLGELITGVLMPVALVGGAVIAVVVIGVIGGTGLMFPAVAYDGSDGLDAVSRSFHYLYVRPWRLGFYTATAIIYGAICYIFVRFFAFLLLWTTYSGLRLGAFVDSSRGLTDKVMAIWPEPSFARLAVYSTSTGSWSESTAALLVYLFILVIVGLVVSFIISFYFTANTIIYALLRNMVENTPLDEIYTPAEETNLPPNEA